MQQATTAAISVNGSPQIIELPMTVAALVTLLGLDTRKVAVERNEAVVPRSTYSHALLGDGDLVEIVHFIGGG